MKVRGIFSILVCMSILLTGNVVNGANKLVYYVSLDNEISITSSGGEIVNGPGVFVPGVEGAAFGGNGSVYAHWDEDDVSGLFEGWDNTAGVTVDLYFSGIGEGGIGSNGDVGLWSVGKREGGDNFLILVARNDEFRFNIRDEGGDGSIGGGTHTILTDGVNLNPATTYRLTVRQHSSLGTNGDLQIFLESISDGGAQYASSDVPIRSVALTGGNFRFPVADSGGGEPLGMRVGDKYPRFGSSGFELEVGDWVDEIRVYNGSYTPWRLDTPFARDLFPADEAKNVPAEPFLSWDVPESRLMKEEPARYNVYFGTEPNELSPDFDFELVSEDLEVTFCIPLDEGVLEMLTDYYWRVDVIDPNNGSRVVYEGDLLHFTTVPPKATGPFPIDGASGVAQNVVLSWNAGYGADEHDIYLGTDELLVEAGDGSVSLPRQSGTSYVCDLAWETEYFWRVDEVFAGVGEPVAGDVWSFTTGAPECEYELGGDVNGDCAVNFDDFAIMAASWMECNLINGNCN